MHEVKIKLLFFIFQIFKVLKSFHTYGYQRGKDPIAGYQFSYIPLVVPEGW